MDISSNQHLGSQLKQLKPDHEHPEKTGDSAAANVKKREDIRSNSTMSLDLQIISSTFKMTAAEKPMQILSKETIEQVVASLNEKFEGATVAVDDIEQAYNNGLDVSPEATADRIVSISTAFFDQYREQHKELSDQQAAESFVELISEGVNKGFDEARDILSSLKVLEVGDVASNIDKTYDLVQEGLSAFLDGLVNQGNDQEE